MGIAAYNRRSAAIRRQADEAAAAMQSHNELASLRAHLSASRTRIAELEAERERAIRCIRGLEASRSVERDERARLLEQWHQERMRWFRGSQLQTKALRRVWGALKALCTVEQVQAYWKEIGA